MPADLNYRGQATISDLTGIRRQLTDWARDVGLPADTRDALVLGGYEAMTNAIRHAYHGRPGILDVHATARPDPTGAELVAAITVTDHGHWQTPPPEQDEPDTIGGRGIPLIHHLADHAEITPTIFGTTVSMHWRLPQQQTKPSPKQYPQTQ